MTIVRNKLTINLTEKEREAIEIVTKLTNDLFCNLNRDDDELDHFNTIMKQSWGDGTDDIEVSIFDLSCLLDSLQNNIDEFNKGISPN